MRSPPGAARRASGERARQRREWARGELVLSLAALLVGLACGPSACSAGSLNGSPAARDDSPATPLPPPPPSTTNNYLETGRQITRILDRLLSAGYDKRVRPNYGGPPVNVSVTMRILSISSVSEVMMDFTADFYFRQTWHDPRLAFRKLGDIHTLYVGAEVSKKIWLPDTFFGNEKMAYFHEATTPNVFLRIDHSGEVYRSIRLTVTSSCPMTLHYFPMDKQRCTIEAESYGYNVKDIIYLWARDTAVERDKYISLPQFDIVKTVQKYRLEELSSGTYSRLIAEIHFARRMGYYLIQIYVPSSLIVVISWVSFWLHRNASPARVQLGVTTVLTMTTLMSSTNSALPKISYVKSIDIFLGTCFVMVFAALLEYATVGYLGKRLAMRKARLQHAKSQAQARLFARLQAQGAQGDDTVLRPPDTPSPLQPPAVPERRCNCRWLEAWAGQQQHQQQRAAPGTCPAESVAFVKIDCCPLARLGQPPNPTPAGLWPGHAGAGCPRRSRVEEAAARAASVFMDAHRRKRGLQPLGWWPEAEQQNKQLDTVFSVRPSDIDKYSRVVFPVCFVCFQLIYWLVYLHISTFLEPAAGDEASSPAQAPNKGG